MYMVLNKDYVNAFVDKHIDQAMSDFKRAEQKNADLTEIMDQISTIRVQRKITKEKKGVDLKCKRSAATISDEHNV